MALTTPNYVQGSYTVAQRDAILTKADKYPDSTTALLNMVPTIAPDGTIQWRQQGGGGDIANANLAPVETSTTASINYRTDDLLIYNGQLYRSTGQIPSGATITPGSNVVPVTIEDWVELICVPTVSRGENLLRNWFWLGGASGYGAFPINNRGAVSYNTAGYSIDSWYLASGAIYIYASGISLSAGTYFLQPIDNFAAYVGRPLTFTAWTASGVYSGTAILSGTDGVQYVSNTKLLIYTDPSTRNGSLVINAVDTLMIYAVKLELGTHQTLIHIEEGVAQLAGPLPDYWPEMQRCLRSIADSNDPFAGLKRYYGTCGTSGSTAAKVVACPGFVLETGAHVIIKFSAVNTASSPTLNINGTGAKTLSGFAASSWAANEPVEVVYDGTNYRPVGKTKATGSVAGSVMLSASTSSTSGTAGNYAATPSAVKSAYDAATKFDGKVIHTTEITIDSIPSTALEFESNQVDTILSSILIITQGANTDAIQGTGVVTAAGATVCAQTYISGGKGYCYVVITSGTVNPTSAKMIIQYTLTSGS